MNESKNNTGLKVTVVLLCIVIAAVSVLAVYLYISYRNQTVRTGAVEGDLARANGEIQDYENALAEKQREAESYSRAVEEQSSAFESERNALNKKIAELNEQISLKRKREAEARGKTVYLTFDDGPSPNTPRILDILDRYGVKATFFVINGGCNRYMGDIVNRGHTIALHSYSHKYAKIYSSDEAYYQDLQAISDVVYNNTGVRTNIIRFPGGSSNKVSGNYSEGIMSRLTKSVQEKGYRYYDWNCESGDASGNNVPVETIVANCKYMPKSTNTVIVLMHDTGAKNTTVEALPQIIEYYRSCGCSFGVITENTPEVHHHVNN